MTRLFGVIGHPIAHSLSPAMHTAALRAMRCDAFYAPFEVPPRFLRPMLQALTLAGIEGLNVTVPLKEAVLPLLDRLDPSAKAAGAVNTIAIRGRRLTGYNTDGIGFIRALRELGWTPGPVKALVLGAGGAARAVAWELSRNAGSELTIANRRLERARRLARWLGRRRPRIRVRATMLRQVELEGIELLVNATTLGMRPGDPPPVDPSGLRRQVLVYDLVYHRPTVLVQTAQHRGCVASGGRSMLLYQGAESLRLWTGRQPPLEVMRRALEQALGRS
jgi:shikimate dehydrogenase